MSLLSFRRLLYWGAIGTSLLLLLLLLLLKIVLNADAEL